MFQQRVGGPDLIELQPMGKNVGSYNNNVGYNANFNNNYSIPSFPQYPNGSALPSQPVFPITPISPVYVSSSGNPMFSPVPIQFPVYTVQPITPPVQQQTVFSPQHQYQQPQQQQKGILIDFSTPVKEPEVKPVPFSSSPSASSPANSFPHLKELTRVNNATSSSTQSFSNANTEAIANALSEHHDEHVESKGEMNRCNNCKFYFYSKENGPQACQYHSGVYRSPGSAAPMMMTMTAGLRWSCCKESEKSALGCKIGSHVKDLRTAKILKSIDRMNQSKPQQEKTNKLLNVQADESESEERPVDPEVMASRLEAARPAKSNGKSTSQDQVNFVKHEVLVDDTLCGLALKYGVTVSAIKQANHLSRDSIYEFSHLKIPNPKRIPAKEELTGRVIARASKEQIAVQRMMRLTHCEAEEAKFYLMESEGDVNKAMELRKEDLEWESQCSQSKKTDHTQRISKYLK